MILNPNKTNALVVSRSRTVKRPHGDLILSGVSIHASPNLDILGVKFDSMLSVRKPCEWYCFSCCSENWYFVVGESCLCGHLCLTSLLLCIVLPILEYCSPVWESAAEYHLHFLERRVYSVAWRRLIRVSFSLSSMSYCWIVVYVEKVNSNSNHCLFSELPSVSTRVLHIPELRPHLIHWSLRCRYDQGDRSVINKVFYYTF